MRWVEDFVWALTLMRARRLRRKMLFDQRAMFDRSFRPRLKQDGAVVIDYPDAIYYIRPADLHRALLNDINRKPTPEGK